MNAHTKTILLIAAAALVLSGCYGWSHPGMGWDGQGHGLGYHNRYRVEDPDRCLDSTARNDCPRPSDN